MPLAAVFSARRERSADIEHANDKYLPLFAFFPVTVFRMQIVLFYLFPERSRAGYDEKTIDVGSGHHRIHAFTSALHATQAGREKLPEFPSPQNSDSWCSPSFPAMAVLNLPHAF